MTRLVLPGVTLLLLFACACPDGKPVQNPNPGSNTPVATGCEVMRAKVESLYRTEAQAKDPQRVDEVVADNTTMVMNDCAKDPGKVSACLERVSTVADLEAKCLVQLDDEGTEGNALR